MRDPTKVTSQPALTSSSGAIWLLVGGLFAAICLSVLIPMCWLDPPGTAFVGVVAVIALYAAMVITRLMVRARRLRLRLLAIFMLSMAVIVLVCLGVVATVQWNLVG
jgi:hypothetical protein